MKKNDRTCWINRCKTCITKNNKQICLMCNEGFFYYKNTCLKKCPNDTIELDNNNICVDRKSCEVNNCEKCINNSKCVKCIHGLYLYENECHEKCPNGTRANRINFTCTNKSSKKLYRFN